MSDTRIDIIPYTSALSSRWDEFARASRSATFLHLRPYMDYHANRFPDRSVLAMRGNKILAMLPCCLMPDGSWSSHGGLTYGGWLLPPAHVDGTALLSIFQAWIRYLKTDTDAHKVEYKPVPHIYCPTPSQEDLYALWRCGFTLDSRLLSSAVNLRYPWKFSMSKRQQLRKAEKFGCTFAESADLPGFWHLLTQCLAERHDAEPVHSLQEMQLLVSRFPGSIRLFTATSPKGQIHAGVLVYDTGTVAHSQYAATSSEGRAHYLLTGLYHYLMTEPFAARDYFDFGTSNEQGGLMLNEGLLAQKFALGATGVAYDTYSLAIPR